jgi:hypothetical protein
VKILSRVINMGRVVIEVPENIDIEIHAKNLPQAIDELMNYLNCTDEELNHYKNVYKIFDQFKIEMTGFRAIPMGSKALK